MHLYINQRVADGQFMIKGCVYVHARMHMYTLVLLCVGLLVTFFI